MRRSGTFAAISIALMLAAPITAAIAQAVVPTTSASADRLAALALPDDQVMTVRIPRFEAQLARELQADEQFVALERERPGINDAIRRDAREEAVRAYTSVLARLRADVSQIYQQRFTEAEIVRLEQFLSSSIGRKIAEVSIEATGEDFAQVMENRRTRLEAMLRTATEAERRDLMSLQASGLTGKMQGASAEISELSERRFGEVQREVDARLPDVIAATVSDFQSSASQ